MEELQRRCCLIERRRGEDIRGEERSLMLCSRLAKWCQHQAEWAWGRVGVRQVEFINPAEEVHHGHADRPTGRGYTPRVLHDFT